MQTQGISVLAKVMVFNTTPEQVGRSAPQITYGKAIVDYVSSYVFLFNDQAFFTMTIAEARITWGYTTLEMLEEMCTRVQCYKPKTKL